MVWKSQSVQKQQSTNTPTHTKGSNLKSDASVDRWDVHQLNNVFLIKQSFKRHSMQWKELAWSFELVVFKHVCSASRLTAANKLTDIESEEASFSSILLWCERAMNEWNEIKSKNYKNIVRLNDCRILYYISCVRANAYVCAHCVCKLLLLLLFLSLLFSVGLVSFYADDCDHFDKLNWSLTLTKSNSYTLDLLTCFLRRKNSSTWSHFQTLVCIYSY